MQQAPEGGRKVWVLWVLKSVFCERRTPRYCICQGGERMALVPIKNLQVYVIGDTDVLPTLQCHQFVIVILIIIVIISLSSLK